MANARRYFEKGLDNDKQRAEYFLLEVQKLYAIERRIRETTASVSQALLIRQQEAIPVSDGLKNWLQNNYTQVSPKSKIGKVIAYSLPRWDRLSLYATDGRLQLDSNTIENVMRPGGAG